MACIVRFHLDFSICVTMYVRTQIKVWKDDNITFCVCLLYVKNSSEYFLYII